MNTASKNSPPIAVPPSASMLANSCLLVQINISVWQARKLDKKATAEVAANHGTNVSIGNYNKRLLPADAPSYERIKTLANTIRTYYYANTLPWSDSGSRILSGSHYMTFADNIRPLIAQFEADVREFIADYPRLVDNARAELNGLFNPLDYPADLSDKFAVSLSTMKITTDVSDFRQFLTENEIALLQANMSQGIANAVANIYEQLQTALSAMAESLGQPDKIFRDSLFGNLKELCDILPSLNITGDPRITQATDTIREKILAVQPDSVRKDKSTRANIAEEAAKLSDAMKGFCI